MRDRNSKDKVPKRRVGVTIVIESPAEPSPPAVENIKLFSQAVRLVSGYSAR